MTAVLSVDAGVTVLQTSPLKLFFGTSNSLGATLRARFSVAPVQTNTVSPVADSYVQNGTFSATNFGDASTLAVKSGGTNQSRETYMRFDLSSIPGTILGATLRLVTRTFDEPIYHALALVTNSTWVESGVGGITWNTKPTSGLPSVIWQQAMVISNWPFAAVASVMLLVSVITGILALNTIGRLIDPHGK